MTRFLSFEQVLTVDERVIEASGGDPGVRDYALLESALSIPSASFDGVDLHATIAAKAAAYHFHICRNHPFMDGNKRTALATAEVFLLVNGYLLDASEDEVVDLTLAVASGGCEKADVTAFFEKHVLPTRT